MSFSVISLGISSSLTSTFIFNCCTSTLDSYVVFKAQSYTGINYVKISVFFITIILTNEALQQIKAL